MSDKKIQIETPIDERVPVVTPQKQSAAGLIAVISSFIHIIRAGSVIRGIKGLLGMNQKRGYDCPGCAWPDPDGNHHIAEFCENGAKAIAEEATTKKATPEVFGTWSLAQLSELSDFQIGKLGRFTEPMIKKEKATHYERISWNDAYKIIAHQLNQSTADESTFYTSGKASNEAAFLFQLFARVLGTNNLPDCSNMCHESSGTALNETIGVGKGTVTLEDFNHADCILVLGQNPGTNHPRMLTALQKAARNGCKIISINPMREAGLTGFKNPQEASGMLGVSTPLTTLYIPVKINGDVAFLKGILKIIFETEKKSPHKVIDRTFIDQYTVGFEEFWQDIDKTSWAEIVSESGVTAELIAQTSDVVLKSKRLITCWAMGITQHKNAIANIQEIVNLHLILGQLGKKGAGVCPVRGHSNVQGDRTMGIWEKMPVKFMKDLSKEFGFEAPEKHGYDVISAIEAMSEGKVKNFISLGGNFFSATPDTNLVASAMDKIDLFVHISTKPHRGHLVTGKTSIILPCLGRTEIDRQKTGIQFITTENSMGVIERSEGKLNPASKHLKSEPAIIAEMAQATFGSDPKKKNIAPWLSFVDNYDTIRDRIEKVIPGFENYNQRIKTKLHFYLPHAVRDELKFNTPTGKAKFTVNPIPKPLLTEANQFLLMTIRSHDQFNTVLYGEDDRYRGIKGGRRVLFMNGEDINEFGYAAGQKVDIMSHFQGETREVKKFRIVPYEIPRRCLACYFPEANPLGQIKNFSDESRQPVYKSIVVTLSASTATS